MRISNAYGFLLDRWDALRESYWFLPGLMAVGSGLAALALIALDRRVSPEWLAEVTWLVRANADGTRSILSMVAGSMITVTGVVFSITVVALTLTSSQFGPRLLRTFLRDRRSQFVLGTFVSTYFYSLLVMRSVEAPDGVPVLATAGAVALATASLFVLIYFVHHAANSIQASSVIAAVVGEIEEQIPRLFPEQIGADAEETESAPSPAGAGAESAVVSAGEEGYVRVLAHDALLDLARECDLRIRLCCRPGDFVTQGSLLALVFPKERCDAHVLSQVGDSFILGDHRTSVQDLDFLIEQLAEMAVRALSPGVNDPNTAIACVHRLGGVLARVAARRMPSGQRLDEDGAVRIEVEPTRFATIAGRCLDGVRRYGAHDASVVEALLQAVRTGALACPSPARRATLTEQAHEIRDAFVATDPSSRRDRDRVEASFRAALEALGPGTRREADVARPHRVETG